MINPLSFYNSLKKHTNFITGVPDSLLKELNSVILDKHDENNHIIAPNEGICVSLGIGSFIATNTIPTVYLQNSGLGNTINPLISLADKDVYGIPMVLIVGWRGEPGLPDEPQHYKQGLIQENLMSSMGIKYFIISSSSLDYEDIIFRAYDYAKKEKTPVFIVVKKDTFSNYLKLDNGIKNENLDSRELAISNIISLFDETDSVIVATTGKASRELYEQRKFIDDSSNNLDFLTVGGMGHASSIATGISMSSGKRVICLDGDGALLMHMGSLVSNGKYAGNNFIHFILNNGVHESVGAQPTLINNVDIPKLALSCGYKSSLRVSSMKELSESKDVFLVKSGPVLIEYVIKPGSRVDLGRPQEKPVDNLMNLMRQIRL